ncbi:MAG: tRNA (adenosine(37)-N6)-threonylcarbamoyltransferase complex ATPase subunit type 1 TsaE [Nitrospirae bacterium]|nr:tRNA (adenosine(37)-N6)-threonylcarbamoyltransferase complex ATPase subunit type 1 TsaE [Nitrospirota bacterium]
MNKTKTRRAHREGTADQVFISRSPEETRAHGEAIGRLLTGGELIALEGPLGTGKTHLVQGLARGLGITDLPITSPTFVFVHEFRGRRPLAHVDLFRIERAEDLPELGILEYLDSPWVVAIEWADKAGQLLPAERLTVRLANQGETIRRIEIEASGPRYQTLLEALVKKK